MENRHNEADPLTDFLQEVKERAHYHYWLFGHYHDNRAIDDRRNDFCDTFPNAVSLPHRDSGTV